MTDTNKPAGYGQDNKQANKGPKTISFLMDGKAVTARDGETIWQVAKRLGTEIPHLCYSPEPGYRADGNCRACMVEIEGERVLAASCIRKPAAGMKVNVSNHRAETARKMIFDLLISDQPERKTSHDPISKFWTWADKMGVEAGRFPEREKNPSRRPQPSGDGGQSRRLHPVQSVRPRLPRSAGQRRHRHGRPRPQRKDRVRLRRPDGQFDLRRLRRMRAGLPDRRADAGDVGRRQERAHRISRPQGRQRLPLLRRRLPAHLQHQERQAVVRHRQATARPTRTGCA